MFFRGFWQSKIRNDKMIQYTTAYSQIFSIILFNRIKGSLTHVSGSQIRRSDKWYSNYVRTENTNKRYLIRTIMATVAEDFLILEPCYLHGWTKISEIFTSICTVKKGDLTNNKQQQHQFSHGDNFQYGNCTYNISWYHIDPFLIKSLGFWEFGGLGVLFMMLFSVTKCKIKRYN